MTPESVPNPAIFRLFVTRSTNQGTYLFPPAQGGNG
jgi:hypothetical protein